LTATARQVLAWTGIVLLGLIVLVVCVPVGRGGSAGSLAGDWELVSVDGEPAVGTIRLPGLFDPQGVPSDALVVARRTVVVPDDAEFRPVWLENPQYAVRLRWDGEEIAVAGDPDRDGRQWRTDESVTAPAPLQPGRHVPRLQARARSPKGAPTVHMPPSSVRSHVTLNSFEPIISLPTSDAFTKLVPA